VTAATPSSATPSAQAPLVPESLTQPATPAFCTITPVATSRSKIPIESLANEAT
jgi:hypothetical protein